MTEEIKNLKYTGQSRPYINHPSPLKIKGLDNNKSFRLVSVNSPSATPLHIMTSSEIKAVGVGPVVNLYLPVDNFVHMDRSLSIDYFYNNLNPFTIPSSFTGYQLEFEVHTSIYEVSWIIYLETTEDVQDFVDYFDLQIDTSQFDGGGVLLYEIDVSVVPGIYIPELKAFKFSHTLGTFECKTLEEVKDYTIPWKIRFRKDSYTSDWTESRNIIVKETARQRLSIDVMSPADGSFSNGFYFNKSITATILFPMHDIDSFEFEFDLTNLGLGVVQMIQQTVTKPTTQSIQGSVISGVLWPTVSSGSYTWKARARVKRNRESLEYSDWLEHTCIFNFTHI